MTLVRRSDGRDCLRVNSCSVLSQWVRSRRLLDLILCSTLLTLADRSSMVCGKQSASKLHGLTDTPLGPAPFDTHTIRLGGTVVGKNITISYGRWTLPASDMPTPLILIHSAFMVRPQHRPVGSDAREVCGQAMPTHHFKRHHEPHCATFVYAFLSKCTRCASSRRGCQHE